MGISRHDLRMALWSGKYHKSIVRMKLLTGNNSPKTDKQRIGTLLQGDADTLVGWTMKFELCRLGFQIAIIVVGAGLYGAAMGWWRDPLQALFVAIKFPLILLLTALGNALLIGMLAPLLGLNISFRQSLLAILMSFAIAAAILGAFAPLVAFLVWNAPPMIPGVESTGTYEFIKLVHVIVIGFAGIASNVRLFQLLTRLAGRKRIARRVLFAWLTVNLFLGSQLAWLARPFIGAPYRAVLFFRDNAFWSNFYENVFRAVQELLNK
jgi:hypothetical protein